MYMDNNIMLVVLTEDLWLHAGLAALLPEMTCLQVFFDTPQFLKEVGVAKRVIIAVDSRIVFRGMWAAFNALKNIRPDATVIWLTRKETGRVFPFASRGERIVHQQQDIVSLRLALRRSLQSTVPRGEEECIVLIGLTPTEHHLLPLLLTGMSMPALSQLTGKSLNMLYTHRYKILSKLGFRQLAFLQLVFERNQGLPSIPWLTKNMNVGTGKNIPYYTEEQIAFALKQAETSTRVGEFCRKKKNSEANFYNLKKKFAGLGLTEIRRLRQLEDENQLLKKLVADLSLDKDMLQEELKQKF